MTATDKSFLDKALTAGALAASLALATSCATSDRTSGPRFWESLRTTGDEVEPAMAVEDMAQAADAVVLGVFARVLGERVLDVPEAGDSVSYLQLELRVLEVVEGGVPGESVVIEFLADAPEREVPGERALVFLHEKRSAVDPPGVYRVLNSVGLWMATERAELDTPLAEEPPAENPLYSDLVAESDSVDEVASAITGSDG